jgi:prepilin-type N-terminal cleavage/methylation domain-containing protein
MNKGFSLVELIVVIAIMAILVGVAVPVYTQYITSANESVDKQTVGEVEHAIEVLLIDNEVNNPTGEWKIKLTKNGLELATASASDATAKAFLVKLQGIVPDAKLKTLADVTFTINGYSVDNDLSKDDVAHD